VNDALKEGGRVASAGRGRQGLRSVLVAAEIAAAMVLLTGAGLMVKGSSALIQVDPNLRPQPILTMQIAVTDRHYGRPYQRAAFFSGMLDRVANLPGVRSATLVSNVPYGDNQRIGACDIENQPAATA
jgi:putative ABC transport system permease protein